MGLLALGAKPSGLSYRPDETELLGWAAHQIGLDLSALGAAQLQSEMRALKDRCRVLEEAFGSRHGQLVGTWVGTVQPQ